MMSILQKKDRLLIDTYYNNNKLRRLYLEKTYFVAKDINQYFIKLYGIDINGKYSCEGYIYFYLDDLKKESSFIGLYVNPECRNEGLASFLIANWLKICMDFGYYKFTTTKKQRKPFLIYLLKKMGFEIEDSSKYDKSNFTIKIYQSPLNNNKYLEFKYAEFARKFMNSSIALEDNYCLLPRVSEGINYIDQVLQSNIYTLRDENEAYKRSKRKIEERK